MTRTSTKALSVARPVIKGLTILNILYAIGITALLVSSFFIRRLAGTAARLRPDDAHP